MIRNMSMPQSARGWRDGGALWLSDQDAVELLGFPSGQNAPYLRQARFSVFRRSGPSIS